jgi:hypothetical protein
MDILANSLDYKQDVEPPREWTNNIDEEVDDARWFAFQCFSFVRSKVCMRNCMLTSSSLRMRVC